MEWADEAVGNLLRSHHSCFSYSLFGTSSGTLSYASQQETNHRDLDEGFAGLDFALVIFAHAPVAR
jgi:hypothetical protein